MSSAADVEVIKMKILATLIIGVALLGVAECASDQSELGMADEEPIRDQHTDIKRQNDPEVVLQLKYDGGELNRIYLTQFRKPKTLWTPSVHVQTKLCEDLCHAGLGGNVCGGTCYQLLPIGLKTALVEVNETEVAYGRPRVDVCPALCSNYLGEPLCQCSHDDLEEETTVNWAQVCDAFCMDGYLLAGCPACEAVPSHSGSLTSYRVLNTAAGWQQWCNVQCPQGNGGLACNCDRTPFR